MALPIMFENMLALMVLPILQLLPALLPKHIAFTLCCFTFRKSTFANFLEICWHYLSPQLLFTLSGVSPAVLQIIMNLFIVCQHLNLRLFLLIFPKFPEAQKRKC